MLSKYDVDAETPAFPTVPYPVAVLKSTCPNNVASSMLVALFSITLPSDPFTSPVRSPVNPVAAVITVPSIVVACNSPVSSSSPFVVHLVPDSVHSKDLLGSSPLLTSIPAVPVGGVPVKSELSKILLSANSRVSVLTVVVVPLTIKF